jgi:hypothetical protein
VVVRYCWKDRPAVAGERWYISRLSARAVRNSGDVNTADVPDWDARGEGITGRGIAASSVNEDSGIDLLRFLPSVTICWPVSTGIGTNKTKQIRHNAQTGLR